MWRETQIFTVLGENTQHHTGVPDSNATNDCTIGIPVLQLQNRIERHKPATSVSFCRLIFSFFLMIWRMILRLRKAATAATLQRDNHLLESVSPCKKLYSRGTKYCKLSLSISEGINFHPRVAIPHLRSITWQKSIYIPRSWRKWKIKCFHGFAEEPSTRIESLCCCNW